MSKNQISELNLLRILSCLIVVMLIHIPNNYAYNYYIEIGGLARLRMHTFGIFVAMGSFVFISGFTLTLKMGKPKEKPPQSVGSFLMSRFTRIFPLYLLALIVFLFLFDYVDFLGIPYIISHFFGMQMVFSPIGGDPIWTLWFVGIILIYYLTFLVFRAVKSLIYIIPIAIGFLALFGTLNIFLDLFEPRVIMYYLLFIVGIIMGKVYMSPAGVKIREKNSVKSKFIKIGVAGVLLAIGMTGYLLLTRYIFIEYNYESSPMTFFSFFNEFGTLLWRYYIGEKIVVYLLVDLTIVCFILAFISAMFILLSLIKLIFKEKHVDKVISVAAYPTYCVYLFHRPLIIGISAIFTRLFGLDMYAPGNLWIALGVIVPLIFIISYGIQKSYDLLVRWLKSLKMKGRERRTEQEVIVSRLHPEKPDPNS